MERAGVLNVLYIQCIKWLMGKHEGERGEGETLNMKQLSDPCLLIGLLSSVSYEIKPHFLNVTPRCTCRAPGCYAMLLSVQGR
jgi:hypothetical protein